MARRSALPVQVLAPLVGGVCGDHGARRYDDAGAGPAGAGRGDDRRGGHGALCRRRSRTRWTATSKWCAGCVTSGARWPAARQGVSVPRMRVVALLATVSSRGYWSVRGCAERRRFCSIAGRWGSGGNSCGFGVVVAGGGRLAWVGEWLGGCVCGAGGPGACRWAGLVSGLDRAGLGRWRW